MRTCSVLISITACVTAALAHAEPDSAISTKAKDALPTPAGPAGSIQTVIVGGFSIPLESEQQPQPVLRFTPDFARAAPGETIRFLFLGNNHSVVQTSLHAPCEPLRNGFSTGFRPNPWNDLASAPSADFRVPETGAAVYMSTLSPAKCGRGMVFAINPPMEGAEGSLADFQERAAEPREWELKKRAINVANPVQQVASTVSIRPQGAVAAASPAPGAPAAAPAPVPTSAGAAGGGTVVQGLGRTGRGQPCSCSCLCGAGSAPQGVGMGQFGGLVGEMPSAPARAARWAALGMSPAAIR